MKTVFQTCIPRPEVLREGLHDDLFAARLMAVIQGTAEPVYGNPDLFFRNTYPTQGLRALVHEVFGRLSGQRPDASPFIRLETSFGGGKTHNLIALYHLAMGGKSALNHELMDAAWLPGEPIQVAGIVGSDIDAAGGIIHEETVARTIWGEIAYQIKRAEGYELLRASDTGLVSPGVQTLDRLIGQKPTLIMIDEIGRYLRSAKAVPTPNGRSELAAQTVAFLMTLIEFAVSRPNVVVVLTLSEAGDAFADEAEEVRQHLAEVRSISARQERVITPATEHDIARIVSYRLFESIDQTAARQTANEYVAFYADLAKQGIGLPTSVQSADFVHEILADYPFHPSLLNALERKLSTIPTFQRTRGALRLLARVVNRLWEEPPPTTYLIHPHHVDLASEQILVDLTSRLKRPQFRAVVEADIVNRMDGAPAHCHVIDRHFRAAKKPEYARYSASTILLHSLTQGTASGIDPADLRVATLFPGAEPQHLERALRQMVGDEKGEPGSACWFLHFDGHRYAFRPEPSLSKIVQDEAVMVGKVTTKTELDRRIQELWRRGDFKPVPFPNQPSDVDDDAREPKLVLVHYDAATTSAGAEKPPEFVAKLFTFSGLAESYRVYRNNLLFLVADRDHVERMIAVTQRYLAINRIVGDERRFGEFSPEQRNQLKVMLDGAVSDTRLAITMAYKHLYYPSSDAPDGLAREVLPAQEQGDSGLASQTVLRVLKQLDKVLTEESPTLPAAYVRAKAWAVGQVAISTDDLRREFARRTGLKILLDINQLKKTIKSGISQSTWIYFDTNEQIGYGATSPPPLVEISSDTWLYTPEEARRLELAIKGLAPDLAKCPLCGKSPCVCGEESTDEPNPDGKGDSLPKLPIKLRAEGVPNQALQQIADEFQDRQIRKLARLLLRCEGMGREIAADIRALGLAIPQLGKGLFRVELQMLAEFGTNGAAERFSLTYAGSWDRYRRLKVVTDPFGQEAARLNASANIQMEFPDGLAIEGEQFQVMRDVFVTLGLGRVRIEAEEFREPEGEAE